MPVRSQPKSLKRWFLYLSVALLFGLGVWFFGFRSETSKPRWEQPAWAGNGQSPLLPVRTVKAARGDLSLAVRAIGTVTPVATVTVKTRVEGTLLRFAIDEGSAVEAGQLIAEIDPAPFLIDVAQAEGQLQQNVARLRSAESDLERTRDLHAKKLVTDQALETQIALVEERKGAVAVDSAHLDDARLMLGYTRIQAPITGRAGLRRVDPGNYVSPGDEDGLVVLTQSRPINVQFTLPEAELPRVLEAYRKGETLVVEAWDRKDSVRVAEGRLVTIDNQIDVTTGTVRLKAEFKNEDERLFPNQFVNVRMEVTALKGVVLIPAVAVQFGSRGTYVYVVDKENKARVRDVVLGPVEGEQQVVTSGITEGEAIVLEGLDRLRDGSGVIEATEPSGTAQPGKS
ncbi:MAG: efflux RND transporter periplasmic adaptor subunit [Opitutaceae bacterium]|nr:efflux RND transporter periplasmic adaptor subunit [Opitutaceae bacterium]